MAPTPTIESFDQLVAAQSTTGSNIEIIIRNYKKDSASFKKTAGYYEERLKRIDQAWAEFETTDTKIRCLEHVPLDHEYFTKNYYENMSEAMREFKKMLERAMNPSSDPAGGSVQHPKSTVRSEGGLKQQTAINSAIRRQNVMMASLRRLLNMDSMADTTKLRERLWDQIQELHFSIWENNKDPLQDGYDMNSYTELEAKTIESFKNTPPSATCSSGQVSSLPLPKISIPKFDGDYAKWTQFYDMFLHMVHQQPIPDVQKMWYLKSNLTGEADKFVSHLSTTEGNYDSAWTMLQERYNNKRVLVTTLVEKIISQPLCSSNAATIKKLHDTTRECLLALNNIGIETKGWNPLLLQILIKKLDRSMHMRFEQSLNRPKELPTVEDLLSFLEFQFQTIESISHREKLTHAPNKTSATMVKGSTRCNFCNNGNHALYLCGRFLNLSAIERLRFVQTQNLCFNCFKGDHSSKDCSSSSCRKCNRKHNTLLHIESKVVPQVKSNTSIATVTSVSTDVTSSERDYVLLATARVKIIALNGNSAEFRAVLDSGSQVNLISEHVIKKLGISTSTASLCIDGVGNGKKRATKRVNVRLQSRNNQFETNLEAFVIPTIIPPQPSQHIDISKWQIPNLELADPYFNRPGRVDILLGAEYYFDLIQGEKLQLSGNRPILLNTSIGWIVSGKISSDQNTNDAATCAVFANNPENFDDELLNNVIEGLWRMEDDGSAEKGFSQDEQQCESLFVQNTKKNDEGRFVVKIPFCEGPSALGDSKATAYKRFLSLERRLMKDPLTRNQYINFMTEYEQLKHMTEIDINATSNPNYFIPHHCVIKPDSTTTKLRAVFDASAKTSSGYSLNDLMYTGPMVQNDLFSILIRFRLPRFVFTTDIEKMYRQILIHPDDRKYQIILWRNDPSVPIKYYQLNTVTYGTRAAPYLATRCLQQIAFDNEIDYPLGAQMLRENFYVDDGLGGSNSLSTALEIQQQLKYILKQHGFNCHKWSANNKQLLQNIPQNDREVNLDFNTTTKESIKTLGLIWLPQKDHLCVKVKVDPVNMITKRTVSSDLAKLFDPLGLVAPIVVKAKIFIQHLWQMKLTWDEALPEDLSSAWSNFREGLNSLNNLQITRHVFKDNIPLTTQLHIFADASERAFGAAAYIRSTFKGDRVITKLLCAKSRVSPIKKQTLPRLELCAALLAAELAQRLRKVMQMKSLPIFLWTDSEIVLSWIHSKSSSFHTFVGNRISKIQTLSIPEQWRHVSSKDNPADILSRGLSAKALSESHLWFLGPLFLHGRQECWPARFRQLQFPSDPERKGESTMVLATVNNYNFVYDINHKGSFKKLQRIISYVYRFVKNTTKGDSSRFQLLALSTEELESSLKIIVRGIQGEEIPNEIKQLKNHQEVANTSPILSLTPFIDNEGILRVGGRLEKSDLSYDSKHPMILPYNDTLVNLLFKSIHEENKHCSPQSLLGIVRQRFWPIKGKSIARSTVQKCILCCRARPKLCQQVMGNLPRDRVTPARPFINTGVDYFGPIWIHYRIRGKKPTKAYVAVFCCFATKAVHFELVSDLSTDAYIGALKRFIGRRGRCQNIYSDNATNFVGANNKLTELSDSIFSENGKEVITSTCSSKGIQFHFIPPRSPHFGGLWEAAVKSAKNLIVRSLSTISLTYEELETVIIEIEAILNSRPLTPMSNDPTDLSVLTPGHLLIGEALTSQVDTEARSRKLSLLSRWELVSNLKHEFWKRWSSEYLHELQQRHKWKRVSSNINVGDMVIIKEDNIPTMKWPLGRILNVFTGDDGAVRVVEVKTATGVFKRPIHRLAPLFIEGEKEVSTEIKPALERFSPRNDKKDTVPTKRFKASNNPIILTALLSLFLMPVVLCNNLIVTQFQNDPGLYFEGIGTVKLNTAEWKMIVYYNLAPFLSEMNSLSSGLQALQKLCPVIQQPSMCNMLVNNIQQITTELLQDEELFINRRPKRSPFNIVGTVARSLFGVLDADYAEEMSKTINKAKLEHDHITSLLKNQTSIIDSTINIIKQDEISTQQNINKILKIIELNKNEVAKEFSQLSNSQIVGFLSTRLALTAINLQRIEAEIINVLTDTHNGKISPFLLSPHQLKEEISLIKANLPAAHTLPTTDDNLIELYKLLSVKGAVTKNEVIFEVKIPLVNQQFFEFFKIIPIPTIKNNILIAIKPDASYLATDAHREEYVLFKSEDLTKCIKLKDDEYICKNQQAKLRRNAKVNPCEINIFNNQSTTNCDLNRIPGKTVWSQLNHQNKWLFAALTDIEASMVCGIETTLITIKHTGIMEIGPNCVIKNNFVTIQGHFAASNSIHTSYIRLKHIESISRTQEIEGSVAKINQSMLHLEELKNLQQQLNEATREHLPQLINSNSIHHHAVSYTALILCIIIVLGLLCWKIHSNVNKPSQFTSKSASKTQPPTIEPAPRSRNQPNFTVRV